MYFIALPDELTLLHLLELQDTPPLLHDLLGTQARDQIERGRWEQGVVLAEQAFVAVHRDHYAASLCLLYKAEALRRLCRWEDALEAVRRALNWLELQVTQVARYNEGLAVYTEGIIHYMLQAEDKTLQTFAYAHDALVESHRFWGFVAKPGRVGDCQNVIRWMAQLLELRQLGMILPVYEWVNLMWIRTGIKAVTPFQLQLPPEMLAAYLPPDYIPVELDAVPFMQLDPNSAYMAVRIAHDGDFTHKSRVGDILIVETTSSAPMQTPELTMSSDHPFVRRTDGRVVFRPSRQETRGLAGIPRVLIREREDVR